MTLRAALDGKTIIGQFTGFTGATITINIPGSLVGRFDPSQSIVLFSVQDADTGSTAWGYRVDTFTSSLVTVTFNTALVPADTVHVMVMG